MTYLFSYVLTAETGFAPHVDKRGKFLTLATCKPTIRRVANKGDWILGVGGKELAKKTKRDVVDCLIYLARVEKTPTFDEYYAEPEFQSRVDNIYHRRGNSWIQKPNSFHDESMKKHDTSANKVLVSTEYLYLGSHCSKIDAKFSRLIKKGPSHKKFSLEKDEMANTFINSIKELHRKEFGNYSIPLECVGVNKQTSCE